MKLAAFFLIICCLHVSAKVNSQTVTLSVKNYDLQKLFTDIKNQTGYVVFCSREDLRGTRPVSVSVANMPLIGFLDLLFKDLPLGFSIEEKNIVLFRKHGTPARMDDVVTPPGDIRGRVVDAEGKALAGATVTVKGSKASTTTKPDGSFSIEASDGDVLLVSYVGYVGRAFKITRLQPGEALLVTLVPNIASMETVSVLSTGYQSIPKERATGSFVQVDNTLLNRRVSTDVLSRLEGVVPGLLFNRNAAPTVSGGVDISIRGRNTLFAGNQPLIVVDNFPYDGDINNINPNDIASVTVLKDAAAASIWGARSGNGVIVITTKKGTRNEKMAVDLNTSITVGEKPDLYYSPAFMNASDFIDVEKNLFDKGFYNSGLNTGFRLVSPVVALLAQVRTGQLSQKAADAQIDALRNIDVRSDLGKYFYQKSVGQQYAINMRGGNAFSDFYLSFGYNKDLANQKGNSQNRVTIRTAYNARLTKGLELSTELNYILGTIRTNSFAGQVGPGSKAMLPYTRLVDDQGNALAITRNYADAFKDTAGGGKLLDWSFKPLDELNYADNLTRTNDTRVNVGMKYTIIPGLTAEAKYQLEKMSTRQDNYYSLATYRTRELINRYTQINGDNITYAIPVGGILDYSATDLRSHRMRAQVNYSHAWNGLHEITALASAEISDVVSEAGPDATLYGYNKETAASQPVDGVSYFQTFPDNGQEKIPVNSGVSKSTDRYISYLANASYTFAKKYIITASGRIEKSNLFGVSTNQKSVPLYSVGAGWELSREKFYHLDWLPFNKLRASYGYTGNVNKNVAAITTFTTGFPTPYSNILAPSINTPGNPELRWEKVKVINLGWDFAFARSIISGSFEYFFKEGIDLFGDAPLPGSTGISTFFGNTANTKGHGFDLVLRSKNINGRQFSWTTDFSLSHVIDKVTKYDVKFSTTEFINTASGNNFRVIPVAGRPIFAIYSYQWGGLDPANGDPQGYLHGKLSKNWSAIMSTTTTDSLVYNGPSRPTIAGYLRNNFQYRHFTLSFNIMYKLNYYFRRTSISNTDLFYNWTMNRDYGARWQKPGDEKFTNVPSFAYPPLNYSRDPFYMNSAALVEKADHIRLQDISIGYNIENAVLKKAGFVNVQVYGYANNLGILWRANNYHLDPDLYGNSLPTPRTYSVGIKANF